MKILSLILIVVGFAISGVCSLGIFYATFTGVSGTRSGDASGLADVAWGLSMSYLLSFANLLGFAILGIGILLAIIGMFSGRKQQNI